VKETGTLTQTSREGTPWDRLNKTATLASSRREIFHHDPQVVNYIGLYWISADVTNLSIIHQVETKEIMTKTVFGYVI